MLQGEPSKDDIVFGSVVLFFFMIFVFAFGYAINRFKNARFARAWRPLQPIIEGKVVEDGGGAATSWLTGRYKSRRVRASMTPDRNRHAGETGSYYNDFDVTLLDVEGAVNWKLPGKKPLEQQLLAAGAAAVLHGIGEAEAEFDAKQGTLIIVQEMGEGGLPSPEHFIALLEALLRLETVNAAVNR